MDAAMVEICNPPETTEDAYDEETPSVPPCRFSGCLGRRGMKTSDATQSLPDNDAEKEEKENCFVNITPPTSQPPSPSLLEPTLHIADETDGGLLLFFASTVKTAVFHLLSQAICRFRQNECYGCSAKHPSQRQHLCLEPYEQDFLLYNYSEIAEDSRFEAYADSLLSQLESEKDIWGSIDDMYNEMVTDDETILVFAEFHRITNVNRRNQFYCELERYTPKLVALYGQKSSRTGKGAEALQEMLRIDDLEEEYDINMRRTLVLRGLPVYLREDDTEFYKTCNGEDEMETTDTPLAFLSVAPDSTGSSSFSPENISIVIEDEVVMSELPRLADAFVVLLGSIYASHLDQCFLTRVPSNPWGWPQGFGRASATEVKTHPTYRVNKNFSLSAYYGYSQTMFPLIFHLIDRLKRLLADCKGGEYMI
ncbi:uncharacterized protein [Nerophis lumbriciformis]|uniref:uncharacterized protein n=1 Tax=Nerophis lumbriciformis TaxID=546530 RepID=UPI003BACBACF